MAKYWHELSYDEQEWVRQRKGYTALGLWQSIHSQSGAGIQMHSAEV